MPFMLNNVNIAGNLTRDPEVQAIGDNTLAKFGLAINRKFKSGDVMKEETTFIEIEAWNRQAELCQQYLSKGRNVFIEGSLKLDQWTDKEGNKRSKISVNAFRVHFLGSPEGHGQASSNTVAPVAPSELDDGAEPPF